MRIVIEFFFPVGRLLFVSRSSWLGETLLWPRRARSGNLLMSSLILLLGNVTDTGCQARVHVQKIQVQRNYLFFFKKAHVSCNYIPCSLTCITTGEKSRFSSLSYLSLSDDEGRRVFRITGKYLPDHTSEKTAKLNVNIVRTPNLSQKIFVLLFSVMGPSLDSSVLWVPL